MRLLAGTLLAMLLAANPANAIMITFSDGDFADWTSTTSFGAAAGQIATPTSSGGNPGGYLNVETVTSANTGTFHTNPGFIYDPSAGAIADITVSLDFRSVVVFGAGQGIMPITLFQDGVYFGANFFGSGGTTGWATFGPQTFTAGNFFQFGGGSLLPDFSTSGAPILIGFTTTNSAGFGVSVDYDNFSASLDIPELLSVPEPPGLAIVIGGLFTVGLIRRGKRASSHTGEDQ